MVLGTRYPDLAGKNVLVTGGAQGIGRAIAQAFHKQDARVAVLDRNEAAIAALQAECSDLIGHAVDLVDADAAISAVAHVGELTGGVDILVNNAGHDQRHDFMGVTPAYWDERFAVNLRHVMFVSQTAAQQMIRRGGGVILNLGSTSWMKGAAGMVAYTTAKAAIHGFTKTVARELGPAGIRVNAIVPGWVMTERQLAEIATEEKRATAQRDQALKIEIMPDDIAAAALFLASRSARAITGQSIVVDAGGPGT